MYIHMEIDRSIYLSVDLSCLSIYLQDAQQPLGQACCRFGACERGRAEAGEVSISIRIFIHLPNYLSVCLHTDPFIYLPAEDAAAPWPGLLPLRHA